MTGESFLFHLLSAINCFIVILISLVFVLTLGELGFANFQSASAIHDIFYISFNCKMVQVNYDGKVSLWNHMAQSDNGPYDDV